MVSQILGAVRNAVRRLASFSRRRSEERAFVAHTFGNVSPSGGTRTLHLENPTNNRVIDVEKIEVTSQFAGHYAIYDVFDGDVTGTDETIDNMLMDSDNGMPDSGDMAAQSDVTYTATGTHYETALPSGGQGGAGSGGSGEGTQPLIFPGRQIVVELTNDSGTEKPGGVGITFSTYEQAAP